MWTLKRLVPIWSQLQAAGRGRFLIQYGVLRWGLLVSVGILIGVSIFRERVDLALSQILVPLLMGAILGPFWAAAMWRRLERDALRNSCNKSESGLSGASVQALPAPHTEPDASDLHIRRWLPAIFSNSGGCHNALRLIESAATGSSRQRVALALVTSSIAQCLNFISHAVLELPTTGFQGIQSVEFLISAVFFLCVLSAVIETMLMAPVLAATRRLVHHPWAVICASAALWAAMHAMIQPGWAVPTFWLFAVFSMVFEVARQKSGIGRAIVATIEVHLFNNLFVLAGNMAYFSIWGPKAW